MKTLQVLFICLFASLIINMATAATLEGAIYERIDKNEKAGVRVPFQFTEAAQIPQKNTLHKERKLEIQRGSVKVFLVAVGDNGKRGKKFGCGDSLVAVSRRIKPTVTTLKAAVGELLILPRKYQGNLENFWGDNNLKIESVIIRKGVATIRLTGERPMIAGACDEPRITLQIEETAKQFSTVKRVKIFVNNQTLAQVIK